MRAKQVPFRRNGTCLLVSQAQTCPRRALQGASKTPAPLPSDQTENDEQDDRPGGGRSDRGADARADPNTQSREQPEPDQCTNHANADIAHKAKAPPPDDQAGKPARNQSNQQN